MSYGVFESVSTDGHDQNLRVRKASRDLDSANQRVTERFGEFLAGATDRGDFNDRVALVKPEMMKVVEAAGVLPVTGVMRKVIGTQKTRWQKAAAATRKTAFKGSSQDYNDVQKFIDWIDRRPDLIQDWAHLEGDTLRAFCSENPGVNRVPFKIVLRNNKAEIIQSLGSAIRSTGAKVARHKTAEGDWQFSMDSEGTYQYADGPMGLYFQIRNNGGTFNWEVLDGFGGPVQFSGTESSIDKAKQECRDVGFEMTAASKEAGVDDAAELVPEDNWDGYLNEQETEDTNKVRDQNFTSSRRTAGDVEDFEDWCHDEGKDPSSPSSLDSYVDSVTYLDDPEAVKKQLDDHYENAANEENAKANGYSSGGGDGRKRAPDGKFAGRKTAYEEIPPHVQKFLDKYDYAVDWQTLDAYDMSGEVSLTQKEFDDIARYLDAEPGTYASLSSADRAFEAMVMQADVEVVSPDSQVPMDTGAGEVGTVEDVAPTDPGYAAQTDRSARRKKVATGFPPEEIDEMRAWARQFGYLSNSIADAASAEDVLSIIKKEYPGGLTQWNQDTPADLPEPDPGAWDGTSTAVAPF